MDIKKEIQDSFKSGYALTKIIYINIALLVIVKLTGVILYLSGFSGSTEVFVRSWLGVSSNISSTILKPWTFITYGFTHTGFLHLLFNMLWLYWFGRVFIQFFGNKKFTGLYLIGSIAGAAFYIIVYNLSPAFKDSVLFSTCIGASASALAIATATAVYEPNFRFNLLFIGPVKIVYIVIFFVILDFLSIADSNAGGHIAHIGGAISGYFFANRYKKGKDITKGLNNIIDNIFTFFKSSGKKGMKVTYKKSAREMSDMEYNKFKEKNKKEVDRILDKIAQKGYDSLTKKEKEILFKNSK